MPELFNPVGLHLEMFSKEIIQNKQGEGKNFMHKEAPDSEEV